MENRLEWEDASLYRQGGAGRGSLLLPTSHFCAPQRYKGPPHPLGPLRDVWAAVMPLVPSINPHPVPTALLGDVQVVSPPSSSPAGTHGTTCSNNYFIMG